MADTGYWYCANCHEEVGAYRVTNQEIHESCGHPVAWIEPTSAEDALRARVAELEKQLDAEKKQSAFFDLQAQRIMIQRDAEKSRALAAEKRLDELESTRCANCGKPNPTIVGGELTDGEAVCSNRCYDQLSELGCPHERHVGYRHPAETEELLSARARVAELEPRAAALESCQRARRAAEERVAELEREVRMTHGALYDRCRDSENGRDAAESRASAAVEAHAQLLSRIAADGTLDAMERAKAAEQRASAAEQRAKRMEEEIRLFAEVAESAVAHHRRPRGGMQVPFHGDFASAAPSTIGQLDRWAKRMRAALAASDEGTDAEVSHG